VNVPSALRRTHESRWVYAMSIAMPIIATVGAIFYLSVGVFWTALLCFLLLFSDAVWRHRSHRLLERLAHYQRIEARMEVDPEFRKRVSERFRARGVDAFDEVDPVEWN